MRTVYAGHVQYRAWLEHAAITTHLHTGASGPVQQQHSIVHHLVRQLQLAALLQDAAHHGSALLQEGHAHVLQHQVVAGLEPPDCLERRLTVLLGSQLHLLHCTGLLQGG